MKLERRTLLRVPMQWGGQPAPAAALASLLAQPRPVLQQLLSGEQLEPQEAGAFLYTPRALDLPGLRLAPQVCFEAHWQAPRLLISLLSYHLPGLEGLERKIGYVFSAELEAQEGALAVRAQATLELATGPGGLGLPRPLLAVLGNTALSLIFGRLERRCHRNLPGLPGSALPDFL